ncbi:MAG: hypothetical protein ACO1G9_09040 [Bacteroidota bacterium]
MQLVCEDERHVQLFGDRANIKLTGLEQTFSVHDGQRLTPV